MVEKQDTFKQTHLLYFSILLPNGQRFYVSRNVSTYLISKARLVYKDALHKP